VVRYCKINNKIDIGRLASKLDMKEDEAEKWIVNLIRNAKLDAKIDSQEGSVIMASSHPSVYQRLIDKTSALSLKVLYIDREREKGESSHSRQ